MRVRSSSCVGFIPLCICLTAATTAAELTSPSGVPLTYSAISDRNVYPEPLLPAIGSGGFVFTDPTFGTKIVRVTDAYTDPRTPSVSWRTKTSSAANTWNRDSTQFVAEANGRDAYFHFNPSTLEAGFGGYLPFQGAEFSLVDPDLIYGVRGFRLGTYRFSTATMTLLSDTTTCPGISDLTGGGGTISISAGDRRFMLPMNGSQGSWNILYVFDPALGCRWYNTQTGQVGGQWGVTGTINHPDRYRAQNARISMDGRYVAIEVGVVAAGNPGPTEIWNVDTLTVTPVSVGPDGAGVAGYGYMIDRGGCGASHNPCIRPLQNVTQAINLIAPPISMKGDGHLSWNNAQPDTLVPLCMSSYLVDTDVENPFEAEIDCVRTDGVTSTVWRFAHPRSKVRPRGDPNYNIWDTPRGNVSQDGRYYMFTSNWEGTLGTDPQGHSRQDVFIIQLAPSSPGAAQLTIDSVTAGNVTASGATITWTTNTPAASRVEYGLTSRYSSATPVDPGLVTTHSVTLNGLAPNTLYHYRVISQDAAGTRVTSEDFSFTTSAIADTTPPTISGVAASKITFSGATISWATNEAATSQVNYGLTSTYGRSTSLESSLVTSHSATLPGLAADTTYHYQVLSGDAAGNPATSGDFTFRTTATAGSPLPIISGVTARQITASGATITWNTNTPAASRVEYGLTLSYGRATPVDQTLVTHHSVALTGLAPDTLYHFRVLSQDAARNRVASGDFTFQTSGGADSTLPIISGVTARQLTASGATITWTTNEGTSSQVNYGLTGGYGKSSSLDGTLTSSHSVTLSGLTADTTYHYQVLSSDAAGNLATSGDFTFRTLAGPSNSTRIPLIDMGTTLYLGQIPGGLYPNQSNTMPSDHAAAGFAKAALIRPLDVTGNPSPNGRYVMIAIGMSNTTDEFCHEGKQELPCDPFTFMGNVAADPTVNKETLVLIDAAASGRDASRWVSPTNYSGIRTSLLRPAGLDEAQVQIAWVKVANPSPSVSLPDPNADAYILARQIGQIVRAMKTRYKNLQQVFVSSRIYAGYATGGLNPEPYAYESGFAVKRVIEAQISQMRTGAIDPIVGNLNYTNGTAPWVAWGPYLWANGTTPRSDGLTWLRSDLESDATHPSPSGRQKVTGQLLKFFKTSPQTSCWFLAGRVCQ